ncbi:MAG TPA: molybdate ABC transporter substrate-binding protein [Thermoanaerobaculia bacterium]|nr:molybdate ABC transporter substrate-binding protein [Thermoanaerobaculia bacterium]
MRRSLLLALLVAANLHAAEVRVLAAASLTDVLQDIAKQYQKSAYDQIVFSFGASNLLARQIEAGAPADLFLSADERSMSRVKTIAKVNMLTNSLVVVVPADGHTMKTSRDLLKMKTIALAEPSSVPAGIYAREWLESQKLWTAIAPRVVPTDNVRSALAAVAAGNADAAIVYKTDAMVSKKVRVTYRATNGPRIVYPFALLKDAKQPQAARRFLNYLKGPSARAIFVRHGFDVLP